MIRLNNRKNTPLAQIARELNTGEDGAREFAQQIFKEIGGYVTFAEILKALKQTEYPKKTTPKEVASLMPSNSIVEKIKKKEKKVTSPPVPQKLQQNREILWISEELNIDIKDAEEFVAQVRNLLGHRVKYDTILRAIKRIERDERLSPEVVASFIPSLPFLNSSATGQIAKKLNVDVKTAASFIAQVQKLLGRSVKLNVILEAIKEIADREQITPDQVASLLQKVQPFDENILSLAFRLREQIKREAHQFFFNGLNLWLPSEKVNSLRDFCRQCWEEINSEKRHYQIPSEGRAEIIASDKIKDLIDLNLVRFVQEDIVPPGVFVEFEFGEQPLVDIIVVKKDGSTEGFHKFVGTDDAFSILIEAIVLAYYRDLVTPGKVYYYQPSSGSRPTKLHRSLNSARPKLKELPRPQNIPLHAENNPHLKNRLFHHLHTWHEARERAKHSVVGHIRWISRGYIANSEKQLQALEHLGKKLPLGYTFVIEHERGSLGSSGLKLSPDGYLTERTLFLPPERALADLDRLLS